MDPSPAPTAEPSGEPSPSPTVVSTAVLVPGDYDVDNIDVQFGDQCEVYFHIMFSVNSVFV